ncbi:MAG: PIN domain-containing protein [Bifidobacteriaceae bacterium]|nr:PIN domain-containing protein [Bifidobacteriaceae bacterium]
MPSVDTNCVLRWLLQDIAEQTAAVERLLAEKAPLTIDDGALLETVFALEHHYRFSRSTVAAALRQVLSEGRFVLDRAAWSALLPDYERRPKLSIMDVYLAHRARKSGRTPLYTFDKKMAAQLPEAELVAIRE